MACDFFIIERPLKSFFHSYGKFVARHPLKMLFLPLVIAVITSAGIYRRHTINDYRYLYTPRNAPSIQEREVRNYDVTNLIELMKWRNNEVPILGFFTVISTKKWIF